MQLEKNNKKLENITTNEAEIQFGAIFKM